MAYPGNGKKEHAFVAIGKDIKEGGYPNLLLLCGEETYLVQWAIDLLVLKTIHPAARSMDFSVIDGKGCQWADILRQCETLPMLSTKRVVVVRDFVPDKPKELLEDFISLPDYTLLIFTQNGGVDTTKKTGLGALVSTTGKIYQFDPLDETQLKGFINKRMKAANVSMKPSVLSLLITHSGYGQRYSTYDLFQMENDLKKMIAHCNQEEITIEDVNACLSETMEINTFVMLDSISKNRKDEAFRLLHDMLRGGENPYRLLSSIASQMELMLCVKELRQEGKGLQEIKRELKVHELRIKKAMAFSEKYSPSELRTILLSVYCVDKEIKTGVLDSELALEMMIAEV